MCYNMSPACPISDTITVNGRPLLKMRRYNFGAVGTVSFTQLPKGMERGIRERDGGP